MQPTLISKGFEARAALVRLKTQLDEVGVNGTELDEPIAWYGQQNGLNVAVFGTFSSGKSSLLNAVLGRTLLPVGVQVTTAAITEIAPADDVGEQLVVRFKSPQRLRDELVDLFDAEVECLGTLDGPGVQRIQEVSDALQAGLGEAALDLLDVYLRNASEEGIDRGELLDARGRREYLGHIARHCRGNLMQKLGTTFATGVGQLGELTSDESVAFAIERATVHLKHDFLEGGVRMIDTPGLGSVYQRHTGVSEAFVRDADVVIFVMMERGASGEDIEFLKMLGRRNAVLHEDKVFYVANRIDLAGIDPFLPEDEVRGAIDRHLRGIGASLARHGVTQPRLYAASGECDLIAARLQQGSATQSERRQYLRRKLIEIEDPVEDLAANRRLAGVPTLAVDVRRYLDEHGATLLASRYEARGRAPLHALQARLEVEFALNEKAHEELEAIHAHWLELKTDIDSATSAFCFQAGEIVDAECAATRSAADEFFTRLEAELPRRIYEATRENRLLRQLQHAGGKAWHDVKSFFGRMFGTSSGKDAPAPKSALEKGIENAVRRTVEEIDHEVAFHERMEKSNQNLSRRLKPVFRDAVSRVDRLVEQFRVEVVGESPSRDVRDHGRNHGVDAGIDALAENLSEAALAGLAGSGGLLLLFTGELLTMLIGAILLLITAVAVNEDDVRGRLTKDVSKKLADNKVRFMNDYESAYAKLVEDVRGRFRSHVAARTAEIDASLETATKKKQYGAAQLEADRQRLRHALTYVAAARTEFEAVFAG